MVLYAHPGLLARSLVSFAVLTGCAVAAHHFWSAPPPLFAEQRRAPAPVDDGAYVAGLTTDGDDASDADPPRLRAVVARRDPTSGYVWRHAFVGSGALSEPRIAVAPDGSVIAALTFEGAIDCGTGPIAATGGADDFDGVVVKLDPDGAVRWIRRIEGFGAQSVASVAIDPWGSVVVAGSFEGVLDLGGGPLAAEADHDVFLLQIDADGGFVWQRRFGGSGSSYGVDVDVARSGNIVLLVRATSDIDLGSGRISASRSAAVVATFDSAGRPLWSRGLGGTGDVYPARARVLPGNRVLVTGSFEGSADFGSGPVASAGRTDAFVAQFDANGRSLGSARLGEALREVAKGTSSAPAASRALGDLLDDLLRDPERPADPPLF